VIVILANETRKLGLQHIVVRSHDTPLTRLWYHFDEKTGLQIIKTQEGVCTLDAKYYENEATKVYQEEIRVPIDSTW